VEVRRSLAQAGARRCHTLKISEAGPHALCPGYLTMARPGTGRGDGRSCAFNRRCGSIGNSTIFRIPVALHPKIAHEALQARCSGDCPIRFRAFPLLSEMTVRCEPPDALKGKSGGSPGPLNGPAVEPRAPHIRAARENMRDSALKDDYFERYHHCYVRIRHR
jgi:hypothetical protein